jgi:hypothetical protein
MKTKLMEMPFIAKKKKNQNFTKYGNGYINGGID